MVTTTSSLLMNFERHKLGKAASDREDTVKEFTKIVMPGLILERSG